MDPAHPTHSLRPRDEDHQPEPFPIPGRLEEIEIPRPGLNHLQFNTLNDLPVFIHYQLVLLIPVGMQVREDSERFCASTLFDEISWGLGHPR